MTPTWTISTIRSALAAKKVSARELTAEYFAAIEKCDPELNSYLTLSKDRAFAQADRVDAAVKSGASLGPLAGVPIAVKDVISTQGVRTTSGSKIL